jgi:hypothetical protein
MKTYEFKFDRRAGGSFTELNDNGKVTIVDRGFNPSTTAERETKKAEYEALGYTEKTSRTIEALREAETREEMETVLKNAPVGKQHDNKDGRDCHNNPVNYKRASVRLPEEMFKIFCKRLVDDGLTAQAFFLQKVEEYIKEAD